jgi:hypothetical protein
VGFERVCGYLGRCTLANMSGGGDEGEFVCVSGGVLLLWIVVGCCC